jgi:hypothetical protein
MALSTAQEDIAEERRRHVVVLRRQRLSHRAIARALERAGQVNPKTGKAWSDVTVMTDLAFIKEQNRLESLKETAEHKAEILADYQEILRRCWSTSPPNLELALKTLAHMRELLGTDAPQVVVWEQMQERMTEALHNLEREFANEPELLHRAVNALVGQHSRPMAGEGPRAYN